MILMGLVFSLSLPSISAIQSHTASIAATEVEGQLAVARSYAIMHHCYTAVVFPQKNELKGAVYKEDTLLASYYYASLRACIVSQKDTGTYNFVMWLPDSSWSKLPNGTIIPETAQGNIVFGTGDPVPIVKDVQIGVLQRLTGKGTSSNPDAGESRVADSEITTDIQRAIVFNPNGEIDSSSDVKLTIIEGHYDNIKKKIIQKERNKKKYTTTLEINPLTARVTLDRQN